MYDEKENNELRDEHLSLYDSWSKQAVALNNVSHIQLIGIYDSQSIQGCLRMEVDI